MGFATISHWRTGTNLLRYLLFHNFYCGVPSCRQMLTQHMPMYRREKKLLGTLRPIEPTLFSLWRLRTRWCVAPEVDFETFIRTPYVEMPRIPLVRKAAQQPDRHNRYLPTARAVNNIGLTPPQLWIYCSKHVACYSCCHFWYDELVYDPETVMRRVAKVTRVKRRPGFTPIEQRVGPYTADEEDVVASGADLDLLDWYQRRFDRWYARPRRTKSWLASRA